MRRSLWTALALCIGAGLTGCSSKATAPSPPTPQQLFVGNGYAAAANRGKIFDYTFPVTSSSIPNFTITTGTATSALESFAQDATNDYVGDCNDHFVRAFTRPMGNASTQAFTLTAASVGPDGLATDASGNLYAGEDCISPDQIDVWNAPVTSASTISVSVTDVANISSVQQIAIDNVNHLFYEAQCHNSKQILEYALPLTGASTAAVSVTIAGETCAEGLAIDPATNQLFVASEAFNKIYEFSLPISGASTPALTITTPTAARKFQDIAFDSAGNLYATDFGTATIDVFVPPFTATSDATFTLTPTGIDSPWGLNIMTP